MSPRAIVLFMELNITQITSARQVRIDLWNVVLDGALDPEYALHVNDSLRDDPAGFDYVRQVNAAVALYAALGDEFLRVLGVDPRDIVI